MPILGLLIHSYRTGQWPSYGLGERPTDVPGQMAYGRPFRGLVQRSLSGPGPVFILEPDQRPTLSLLIHSYRTSRWPTYGLGQRPNDVPGGTACLVFGQSPMLGLLIHSYWSS